MTNEEFEKILAMFADINHKAYPNTRLINVIDSNDIIHSYYASTGTAIFRNDKDKYGEKEIVKNIPPEKFIRRIRCKSHAE